MSIRLKNVVINFPTLATPEAFGGDDPLRTVRGAGYALG